MTRRLYNFFGGLSLPGNKSLSNQSPSQSIPIPPTLVLPLHQHIGEAAEPLVQPGTRVLKGQMLARAKGYVSAPIHAPTSGHIIDICDHAVPHPSGLHAPCIRMASDGQNEWVARPNHGDYHSMDPSHLRNVIREAGIVGLGGAGFPTSIKLNPGPGHKIDVLIINGVECEPYITCDDRLMREHPEEIIQGARLLRHAVQAKECIIAVEDNKQEAYDALVGVTDREIGIVQIPTLYPAGSEKQLIKVLTNREVPSNGLPFHVGVVMQNVATALATYRALHFGEPLISRYVTVTGDAVAHPGNYHVLLGTPAEFLLDHCGVDAAKCHRLVVGGPMMGFAVHSPETPVVKTTNCLLASTQKAQSAVISPCIRCGACMDVCPVQLLPQQLYWHTQAKEFDVVQKFNLFDCIECGCCAYVCPSHIPLVQYYRHAKAAIWAREREKKKAEIARQRHEFRELRLQREKEERANRHQRQRDQVQTTVDASTEDAVPHSAILDALARVEAKKAARASEASAAETTSNHRVAADE